MTTQIRLAPLTALLASLVAVPGSADDLTPERAARVRVIHASPDTPAVDVLLNDVLAPFGSLQFGDVTEYAEVPADVYDLKVVPAGAGPESAAIQAELNLFYGTGYTVVAVGTFDAVRPLVLVDDESAHAGQARVRFVHAAPDAPAVDMKVADGPYLFQGVSFEEIGESVAVPDDDYTLEIRVAGTDTVVLEVPDVAFQAGSTYTLLAIGLLGDGTLDAMVAEVRSPRTGITPLPRLVELPLAGIEMRGPRPGALRLP